MATPSNEGHSAGESALRDEPDPAPAEGEVQRARRAPMKAGKALDACQTRQPPELDASQLLRCKEQNPMAFHLFVLRYQQPVFAFLSRLVGHGPHVEDLSQDALLRAYVGFPRFDVEGTAKPSTWLLKIAHNVGVDWLRRPERRARPATEEVEIEDHRTPEEDCQRRQLGRAIEAAILSLSPKRRAVFVLAQYHGLTLEEIAATLEIPLNTVKTRLFRARETLAERLAPFRRGSAR